MIIIIKNNLCYELGKIFCNILGQWTPGQFGMADCMKTQRNYGIRCSSFYSPDLALCRHLRAILAIFLFTFYGYSSMFQWFSYYAVVAPERKAHLFATNLAEKKNKGLIHRLFHTTSFFFFFSPITFGCLAKCLGLYFLILRALKFEPEIGAITGIGVWVSLDILRLE